MDLTQNKHEVGARRRVRRPVQTPNADALVL